MTEERKKDRDKKNDALSEVFVTRMRVAMDERSVTQKELAKSIGLTEAGVSRIMKGARLPRATSIVGICRTLGVSSDWLLGLDYEGMMHDPTAENRAFLRKKAVEMVASAMGRLLDDNR